VLTSARVTSTLGVGPASPQLGVHVGELMLDSGRRLRRARDPCSPDLRPCGAGGARAWEVPPANRRPQALCGRPRPLMRHRCSQDFVVGKQTLCAATACPRHWPPSVRGA
jgi:hypothetical protein